mgnify:CR=1 FL=1
MNTNAALNQLSDQLFLFKFMDDWKHYTAFSRCFPLFLGPSCSIMICIRTETKSRRLLMAKWQYGKFLFMSCVWVVMKSQVSSLQYYDNITKKLHFTFFHCFSASSAPIPSVLVAIDSCACNSHSVTWFISNTFVCILQSTNAAASMGRSRRDALVICSTSGRIITSYRPHILLLCRLQQG